MAKARSGRPRRAPGGRAVGRARGVPARLWAPWRLAFIEKGPQEGCIFCRFPEEGPAADRKNLIVHRAPRAFAILNRYPYNSGHLMVVPRAHVARFEALSPEDFHALHEELRLAEGVLRAVYRPDGMNVGMNLGRVAGAGIADHLHYHLVPRWAGDTNFMPVLADTRVMVEHLDATYERVRRGFGGG